MQWRTMKAVSLGLCVALVGCTWTNAAEPVPLVRSHPPTLTCNGKTVYEGRRVLLDEDSYPRRPANLIEGPSVERRGGDVRIVFALDRRDDVLVRVTDARGNTVRNLACGVLGENAPGPFKKNSLEQEIVWDGKGTDGKPAPVGCRVRVAVGLTPRFDRFVAHDPAHLLDDIRGLEVDGQGRVYVSVIPMGMADPEIVRFDREGRYVDTINPPNPNRLAGRLEDVYPECNYVDGVAVPAYRGYRPFFQFYLTGGGFHPIRISSDGKTHVMCIKRWFHRGPGDGPRVYTADRTRPFWFRKPLWTQFVVWAVDQEGFAYYRDARKGPPATVVIRKIHIATDKPAFDFEYHGVEKLAAKRDSLGTGGKAGEDILAPDGRYTPFDFIIDKSAAGAKAASDGKRLAVVRDIAVDSAGNLFVADAGSVKVYAGNGRFLRSFDSFALAGKKQALGEPFGLRVADRVLYVVAKLPRPGVAHLVKFALGAGAEPRAVWTQPLDRHAMVVAVDGSVNLPVVWVGNGGGPATVTRIVDEGDKPGPLQHVGGRKRNVLVYPAAIALDGKGRIFVQDYQRGVLVRTNDDGTQWTEAPLKASGLYSLFVDKKRGHLYRLDGNTCLRCDLDMKELSRMEGAGHANLGAVDAWGNVYVAQGTVGTWASGKGPRIGQFDPEGNLVNGKFCEVFAGRGGLAMDSGGCIYVMDTCETVSGGKKDAPGPGHFHDMGRPPGPRWKRDGKTCRSQSDACYIVKFAPGGGRRGSQAELWSHSGASPVMYHCKCRTTTNNVAVDEATRVFATDTTKYHVKVLDAAGNLITRVGAWGSHDCRGPQSEYPNPEVAFAWPYSLDASGDVLYVSDKVLRRVVKVRMDYREIKEATVP